MPKHQNEHIRILIVDDHPVVRAGLASMLGTQAGLKVIGSASGGEEALKLLQRESADVILLDLRMPGMNGIEVLRALSETSHHPKVIVLTSFETDEDIYRAVQAGAKGYLLKDTPQSGTVVSAYTEQSSDQDRHGSLRPHRSCHRRYSARDHFGGRIGETL